ncbi:uncharacterized protein TM35_000063320 [Trypanosoma theileri]|uniref:Voltage-dependent anion-selective channel n=1 Tax=Trypanosoma theileri TaxID=67003 RepID=A0A1X0P327_9TRYP|nr:uncharacterized protein TM35_000063320 [Trypanosoma theileri]ORC91327.1 hypothetical protein TM35_000063320 [Trypanosoma theileri]
MAPDTFTNLVNTVEQYAKKGSCERRWRLSAVEDYIPANRLNGYPFATADAVGVHLACRKGNLTVSADISSNPKSTWRDFLPSIIWKKSIQNQKHEFQLRLADSPEGITGKENEKKAPIFAYTLLHPSFTFTSESQLMNGFNSTLTATTRLSDRDQLGFSTLYDPSRSGVKDYTFAYSRCGCNAMMGGDFMAKYNAIHGSALHMRFPVNRFASAVILAEKTRFIIGADSRSPCGAQLMMNVNIVNTEATLSVVRNLNDMWKITMCYVASLQKGTSATPKFGIVFSTHDSD